METSQMANKETVKQNVVQLLGEVKWLLWMVVIKTRKQHKKKNPLRFNVKWKWKNNQNGNLNVYAIINNKI